MFQHSYYFTQIFCFSEVGTIEQYFPVFDKLRKEFLVGELIWNFADFMTKQGLFSVTYLFFAFVNWTPLLVLDFVFTEDLKLNYLIYTEKLKIF